MPDRTLNTDAVAKRVEYAIHRCAKILMDIRTQPGDLHQDVRDSRFVTNIGDILAAELDAWGFDVERGWRAGGGAALTAEVEAPDRPTRVEAVAQSWKTLDGLVWALREAGVPVDAMLARVKDAASEYDPDPRPAFTIIDGGQ